MIVLAGASAACTSSRFSGLFTGSTQNQREIIGQSNYAPDDTQQGYSAPYNAPNAQAYNSQNYNAPSYGGPVTSQPLPPPTQVASLQPNVDDSMVDSAATYGWTAVGGQVITVGRNETLDALAIKFGVPQNQLLSVNQMNSAADVRPGRIMVIPRRVAMANTAPRQAPVAAPEPYEPPARPQVASTGSYLVQPGDTLYGISRKTGYSVKEIAAANGIPTTSYVQIGQRLRLPGPSGSATYARNNTPTLGAPPHPLGQLTVHDQPRIQLRSPADEADSGEAISMSDAPKAPPAPRVPTVDDSDDTTMAAIDNAADAASADGESFRWPVRGRIISGFGSKPNGEKNDGINLAVPEGTSVKAIEAGTVIYAGNELEGYGNLVLVRHAGGWVSAYAHNKDLLVKRGDTVRRGQVVAHAGMTGSVTSPQVHFELRKGAKPVNPLDYLAG